LLAISGSAFSAEQLRERATPWGFAAGFYRHLPMVGVSSLIALLVGIPMAVIQLGGHRLAWGLNKR
jgi:ABC-type proline/glycine betaine transport system permease subunit